MELGIRYQGQRECESPNVGKPSNYIISSARAALYVIGPSPRRNRPKSGHRRVSTRSLFNTAPVHSLAYKNNAMPADRVIDEDEDYQSSQDSDFAPDDAPDAASGPSDSEDETDEAARKRRRPVNETTADGGDDYDNSGDEAIIERGRKRQKRAKAKGETVDDEGGEGGLIKTRRQRAAEYVATPAAMRVMQ